MTAEGNILWNEFRQTGSRKDFKRLFDAYYDTLVRYAWWFLKSREDSEEVILDLMLHFVEKPRVNRHFGVLPFISEDISA